MSKLDKKIAKKFSKAMERGDYDASDELIIKNKAMLKGIVDYMEEVEREYFKWGFIEGQKSKLQKNIAMTHIGKKIKNCQCVLTIVLLSDILNIGKT